ncbi:RIP metalloprotease RseP [Lysobacteraceae bacterium NML08-0793]|nr:RIP metalloprotease RseP [Xanthomonadaceae bacterium NML08-0793]
MSFFGPLFWLIVSLGILVTIHEFGHFWVARRCGVKVLRFSVGFGKPLWLRRGRDGTEYAIAAIPLGGYVRMLDEREAPVNAAELGQAFNRKPLWQRAAIVAAGPLANLALCVGLLWLMFMVGRPDYRAEVGRAEGIAAESGFQHGDVIQSIQGQATPTWSEAGLALLTAALDREAVSIEVRDAHGQTRQRTLHLERLPAQVKERDAISATGIVPAHYLLPAIVGQVGADAPAAGKLQSGDHILAVNGQAINDFSELSGHINRAGEAGQDLLVRIARGDTTQVVSITPAKLHHPERGDYWGIGISLPESLPLPPKNATLRYAPLAAIPAAFTETWRLARQSFEMMARMVQGRASLENISGPITIARVADRSADMGLAWFLSFLALISLSLAIINLLPIPVLDGGHLLYYLIELVKGSPPGERFMAVSQFVGLAIIACLMGLAFYNDIHGLLR